jgi:hypothetical protein
VGQRLGESGGDNGNVTPVMVSTILQDFRQFDEILPLVGAGLVI